MNNKEPITISFDLETSPQKGYFFGRKWDTNISQIDEYTSVLSYSVKYLEGEQITKGLINYKGYKAGRIDDKNIVKDIWNLFNDSDIIITQNGKSFDMKIMNARFIFHGLKPPSPYKEIDTKTEAKKLLNLPSYSLDDMCDYFNIGRKKEHEGFSLWMKCMSGDKTAWKRMLDYNKNDTILTEKLYLKLRPWMRNIPVGMFAGRVCPRPGCGGTKLHAGKEVRTKTMRYKTAQCQSCGGYLRFPMAEEGEKPFIAI